MEAIREEVADQLKEHTTNVITTPVDNRLRVRTLREVANVLLLSGHDNLDTHHVGRLFVGTLQVHLL